MSEYYRAYEERYRAVRDVGEFTWGHTRDDERFTGAIGDWVRENELSGKRVAEFACGEGAAAVLLCGMGCIYEGYDIAPTAVEICQRALAGFDTGAHRNVMIYSVPEGDDKPLKYPLMYETCDLLVINKIDVLEYFDFDCEKVVEYAKLRNPFIEILFVSAKTGEGMEALADWIEKETRAWIG